MRFGALLLFAIAIAAFAIVVLVPGFVGLGAIIPVEEDVREAGDVTEPAVAAAHIYRTVFWALAVAFGAAVLAWIPGQCLGRLRRRVINGSLLWLVSAPILLPAYLVYYAWGLTWLPGSALFEWAIGHGAQQWIRAATLYIGLICWSWPIVALCIAGAISIEDERHDELMQIDGAGLARRQIALLRRASAGVAIGFGIVFLFIFNNTACFDFAQVRTLGYELRALSMTGATPREVMIAGLPGVVIAVVGAILLWLALRTRASTDEESKTTRPRAALTIGTVCVLAVSIGIPFLLLVLSITDMATIRTALVAHGSIAIENLGVVGIIGLAAVPIMLGLTCAWMSSSRTARMLADLQLLGWIIFAALPGTVVAIAIEAAYNRSLLGLDDIVYDGTAIVIIGALARFGFIAALIARWVAGREPQVRADLRHLDAGQSLRGLVETHLPLLWRGGVATVIITGVLTLSEIPVSARLHPPGYDSIARILLDGMHYQRHESVSVVAMLLIAIGLTGAGILVLLLRTGGRRVMSSPMMFIALGLAVPFMVASAGCEEEASAQNNERIDLIFGGDGTTRGRFNYPRAIDVDRDRNHVYVIDMTARVQRFGFDGSFEFSWQMPAFANGKPTGVSVHPDGRVFVADTHEHRILAFDQDGQQVMAFGTFGEEPGQFIFPTDIAFRADRIYVSEFGGNDRVQVFDDMGSFLFEFGAFGTPSAGDADGVVHLNRAQSLAFSPDGARLYIADAINHRVVVTDPEGNQIDVIGGPGSDPGRFRYPYGLDLRSDGTILVAEFGNSRVQHLRADGTFIAAYGEPGRDRGELYSPWGVAGDDGMIFLLDSRNNRVQRMALPVGQTESGDADA